MVSAGVGSTGSDSAGLASDEVVSDESGSVGTASVGISSDGAVSVGIVSAGIVSDGTVSDGAVSDGSVSDGTVFAGCSLYLLLSILHSGDGRGTADGAFSIIHIQEYNFLISGDHIHVIRILRKPDKYTQLRVHVSSVVFRINLIYISFTIK